MIKSLKQIIKKVQEKITQRNAERFKKEKIALQDKWSLGISNDKKIGNSGLISASTESPNKDRKQEKGEGR